MKIKKMVGALALTAALAMGSVPAFAVPSEDGKSDEFSDSGSTEVKATVDTVSKQVRASVPLSVAVVFAANGAGEITGPTAGAYKITNIGEGDIKLTDIAIEGMNNVFTSSAILKTGTDYTDTNGDEFTTGDHLMLTIKTAGNTAYLTTDHSAKAQKKVSDDKAIIEGIFGTANVKAWSDELIEVGNNLPIELGGLHVFNSTLDSGEMTDTLCNLKCTIAAA